MKVTVCDVCQKRPTMPIRVPTGRSHDGVEYGTDWAEVDACLEHAVAFAQTALLKLPENMRAEVLNHTGATK